MAVWESVLLGAAGGGLVELLAVLGYVLAWQRARRTPGGRVRKSPPRMRSYVDVPAHLWVLAIRAPLGAFTAWLFAVTSQTSGPYAALAVGFAAPALLAQLGQFPQVTQALQDDAAAEPSPAVVPASAAKAEQSGQAAQPQEVERS
ncbi:hypothetical protein [Actinomadura napierensis]